MLISVDWLKDYVDINCSIDELCAKLVSVGFEVEEVIRQADNCKKCVVGRIEKLEPHPDADKLQICSINIGSEIVQIVTGATNVKVGDLVPAALDGSDLPCGMHIKKGKLRGVASNGMLCSGEELKVTEDDYKGAGVYGIMILNENYPLGTDINEVIGTNDIILDIGVTANRPDCNSVFGIAREVATVLNQPLKMPSLKYEESTFENTANVVVENAELCPRYMLSMVKNVVIKPSPKYIQKRLKAVGLRPINNIVDITNYVLMDIGQPMHAFDLANVANGEIIVRNAVEGEKITLLNGVTYTLTKDMLVIADSEKPSVIAGIMGGSYSGISENTKDIIFESAKFVRESVRRTSRKLNVRSDSSARYERGIDLASQEIGMKRALQLIYETKSGDICKGIVNICKESLAPKQISCNASKINEILGINVPEQDMVRILNSLQIKTEIANGVLNCSVPLYRDDIENANDLAEEIIRLYGYDHITCTLMDSGKQTIGGKSIELQNVDNIKNLLIGEGMNEVYSYSFTTPKMLDLLEVPADSKLRNVVKLLNPLGEDLSIMRTTLAGSMIEIMAKNITRGNKNARFFEFANTYMPKALPICEQPVETQKLALGVYGETEDFYTIKGIIENIIAYFGVKASYVRPDCCYLHPGISADVVVDGKVVATFGEVRPDIAAKYDIKNKIYVAEIDFDLLNCLFDNSYEFKAIAKFPTVERDLAVVVEEAVTAEQIIGVATKYAGKTLSDIRIFDIYRGKGIEKGYKSVAIKFEFTSYEKTLTDEEINNKMNKVIKMLDNELNAKLR